MSPRKILTGYWMKPIPLRQFDWFAWYDGDEESGRGGHGLTEDEAIEDLETNFPDEE